MDLFDCLENREEINEKEENREKKQYLVGIMGGNNTW